MHRILVLLQSLLRQVWSDTLSRLRPRRGTALGVALVAALVAGLLPTVLPAVGATTAPSAQATGTTAGNFVPVTARIYDSRSLTPLTANTPRSIKVTGANGIPSTGVSAIEASLIAVNYTASCDLWAAADGAPNPGTTALHFSTAYTSAVSNTAIVPVNTSTGKIEVSSCAQTDLIIDVQGYYTSGSSTVAGGYVPVTPARIADTRNGVNVPNAKVAPGGTLTVQVAGKGGVPSGAALPSSAFVNITVINSAASGSYITAYATGGAVPNTAMDYVASTYTAIGATVPLDQTNGRFSIKLPSSAPASVDVIVDVEGYFSASATSDMFVSYNKRVFDSRSSGTIAANSTQTVLIAGKNGVPAVSSGIAVGALEVHVQPSNTASGYVEVYQDDAADPGLNSINFGSGGADRGGLVVASLGADGGVKVKNSSNASVDVLIDIQGWYVGKGVNAAPATPSAPSISRATSGTDSAGNPQTYIGAKRPTFSVTDTDPNGDQYSQITEVHSSKDTSSASLVASCHSAVVASSSPAPCTLSTDLSDNTIYYATTRATDSFNKANPAYSSFETFAVSIAAPAAPTVSCPAPYSNGYWTSTVPASAVTCTVTAAAGTAPTSASQLSVSVDGAAAQVSAVTSSQPSVSVRIPAATGVHVIQATARSFGGVSSSTSTYRVGFATASVFTPASGTSTTGSVNVAAYGPPAGSAAHVTESLRWRIAGGSDTTSGWNTVDSKTVTPTSSSAITSYSTTWNSAAATTDTSSGASVTLPTRIPMLFEIEVCFQNDAATPACTVSSGTNTVLRLPSAFGPGFATSPAGEGTVALGTGEFRELATDVDEAANIGRLQIGRNYSSFSGLDGSAAGIFGPGWNANFGNNGDSDLAVIDATTVDGTISFLGADGTVLTYREPNGLQLHPTATYVAVDSATIQAAATVKVSGSTLTMTDGDGTTTKWTYVTGTWVPTSVSDPGSGDATTYVFDPSTGAISQIIAPAPDGVTCTATSLNKGCTALLLAYGATTTATSTTPGDFSGQLKSISYRGWDANSAAMRSTPVAFYQYDTGGRLVTSTDPRTGLSTTYTYAAPLTIGDNTVTELASSKDTGYAKWTYVYTTPSGGNPPRLDSVLRDPATGSGSGVMQSRFVYGLDPAGLGPDVSQSTIAKWGQTRVPTTAAAVFGMDHPVSGSPSSTDWPFAALYYSDNAGYNVNNSEFGAGQWLTTYAQYDESGNFIAALDPEQTAAAAITGSAESSHDSSGETPVTRYVASAPGIAEHTYIADSWSAPYAAMLPSGSMQTVRLHTAYTYDEQAPNGGIDPATGQHYMLPTTITVGYSSVTAATTDSLAASAEDEELLSITSSRYDPIDGADVSGPTSGWTLRTPTQTTKSDPKHEAQSITRKFIFDKRGTVVAQSEPGSSGSDAGTTKTVLYSVGENKTFPQCGNKPEYSGLLCWRGPAADASSSGVPDIPDTEIRGYNYWLDPTKQIETSGTGSTIASRTTDLTYTTDDGRLDTTTISTVGLPNSVDLPVTVEIYDSTTHALRGAQTGSGSSATSDLTSFDQWGRQSAYTEHLPDGSSYVTSTSYVAPGQPGAGAIESTATPAGETHFAYDGTDAAGAIEHRGVATQETVSGVGTFIAAYDKRGNVAKQITPGGMAESYGYNEIGALASLQFKGTDGTPWVSFSRDYDPSGRAANDIASLGSSAASTFRSSYNYDFAGRLIADYAHSNVGAADEACLASEYGFDIRGNRTTTSSVGVNGTDCADPGLTAPTSYVYDSFSRQKAGAGGESYQYDSFGRQLAVPASDAPGDLAATSQIGYYADDSVRSLTQSNSSQSWTLDAAGRRSVEQYTAGSDPTVTTVRHYSDETDNPRWTTQGSTTTRYAGSLSDHVSAVVASTDNGASQLLVTDLTGAAAAIIRVSSSGVASAPATLSSFDPYGNAVRARQPTGALSYGWKGGAQRESASSGLVLMGSRIYNPSTGRFTSIDPVFGGNENSYNYPDDPINYSDTSGQSRFLDGVGTSAGGGGYMAPGGGGGRGFDPFRIISRVNINRIAGKAFESKALARLGVSSNGKRIRLDGALSYWVPDGLTRVRFGKFKGRLIEVKGVKRLRLTTQLKAFLRYSQKNDLQFVLVVLRDTVLSRDLMGLANDKLVTIVRM